MMTSAMTAYITSIYDNTERMPYFSNYIAITIKFPAKAFSADTMLIKKYSFTLYNFKLSL